MEEDGVVSGKSKEHGGKSKKTCLAYGSLCVLCLGFSISSLSLLLLLSLEINKNWEIYF